MLDFAVISFSLVYNFGFDISVEDRGLFGEGDIDNVVSFGDKINKGYFA